MPPKKADDLAVAAPSNTARCCRTGCRALVCLCLTLLLLLSLVHSPETALANGWEMDMPVEALEPSTSSLSAEETTELAEDEPEADEKAEETPAKFDARDPQPGEPEIRLLNMHQIKTDHTPGLKKERTGNSNALQEQAKYLSTQSLASFEVEKVNVSDVEPVSSSWENCSTNGISSVGMLVGKALKGSFSDCALVGGSQALLMRESGREIDQHEAVIRINRLPSPRYSNLLGNRTTIYFAGAVADARQRYIKKGYVAQRVNKSGELVTCRYDNNECNFDNLVMNSGTLAMNARWTEVYPRQQPGWRPDYSEFPIAHMSDSLMRAVRLAERAVLGLSAAQRSTSGISALFLAAVLCDSISVYGMASPGTLDSHYISEAHDMKKEQEFLLKLAAGYDLRPSHCPSGTDYKEDCEAMQKIICSIGARAREGKFELERPPARKREGDSRDRITPTSEEHSSGSAKSAGKSRMRSSDEEFAQRLARMRSVMKKSRRSIEQ